LRALQCKFSVVRICACHRFARRK